MKHLITILLIIIVGLIISVVIFVGFLGEQENVISYYKENLIQTERKLRNSTLINIGSKNSAINDVGGDSTINYSGIPPQVTARLEELLNEKDIELAERQKTIDQWIERYRDLEQQLAQRPKDDTLAREAKVALDEGKFEEAEALLRRSLESHLKNLETFSGKAGQDAYSLGHIAELQLDYRKAQRYFEQAAVLVPENSTYLNRAGLINHTLGAYGAAIRYYEQALASDLKTYGEDHPNVARDRNNLGGAYQALGEYRKAIGYFEQALASDLKAVGEDHPNVAIDRNNLGSAYDSLGEYRKAIRYFEQALASDLKTYGEDHPNVALRRNNLGSAYKALGEVDRAIRYYEQALASDLKTVGEDHPNVAIYRNNLGEAYRALGEYRKAIGYYEQALASDLKTYGEDHPNVAIYRNNLGGAYQAKGEVDRAIRYYEQALASDLKTYGEDHLAVARDRTNLGGAYQTKGEFDRAIRYYEQALAVLERHEHPHTKSVRAKLAAMGR